VCGASRPHRVAGYLRSLEVTVTRIMAARSPLWLRLIAYVAMTVIVYLLVAAAVFVVRGEGAVQRVGAACLAVACVIMGRYISQRVWGKAPAQSEPSESPRSRGL